MKEAVQPDPAEIFPRASVVTTMSDYEAMLEDSRYSNSRLSWVFLLDLLKEQFGIEGGRQYE